MKRLTCMLAATTALLSACSGPDTPHGAQATAPVATATLTKTNGSGRDVFEHWCAPCHAAGPGHPGTNRLAERLGRENSVLLERRDLAAPYVEAIVRNGFQMMPPFRVTEISDAELQAVAAYVADTGASAAAH